MRKYWLIFNDKEELVGYSTYKQFNDQVCVDELPEQFVTAREKEEERKDSIALMAETMDDILEYLEDVANEEPPKLTKQEFKDLCLQRKNARIKVKS